MACSTTDRLASSNLAWTAGSPSALAPCTAALLPAPYIASCCHVVYAYLHAYELSYAIDHEKDNNGCMYTYDIIGGRHGVVAREWRCSGLCWPGGSAAGVRQRPHGYKIALAENRNTR